MTDFAPPRLSAVLTMSGGRTVHVAAVPVPEEPASQGRITVGIPYPGDAEPGIVVSAAVGNQEMGLVFRTGVHKYMQPGGILTVSFGVDALVQGDIGRVFHGDGLPASGGPVVEHDPAAGALYARLRQGEVARTVAVSVSANVDLDAHGHILGVEVLGGTDWPEVLVRLAMDGRLRLVSDPRPSRVRLASAVPGGVEPEEISGRGLQGVLPPRCGPDLSAAGHRP